MKTLMLLALISQFPQQPDKSQPQAQPGIPSKTTPLASPQASPQYAPQQSFAPVQQYDQPAVVLRAVPQVFAVQRLVTVAAAPVAYTSVAYDGGCGVAQQQVIQRSFIQHSAVVGHGLQAAQVNHGLVGNGVGRQPKKIKTKQVTRVKRGLFGGRG